MIFTFISHLHTLVLVGCHEDLSMILIELYNGRIVYGGGSRRSLRASDWEPKGEVSLQNSSKDTIKIYLEVQSGLIKSWSSALRTIH